MRIGKCNLFIIISLLIVLLVMVTVPVFAQEEETEEPSSTHELLVPYAYMFNENIDQIPGVVKSMFDGERINLYVDMGDGTEEIIGITTLSKSCLIEKFLPNELEDPTLLVYIDRATIDSYINNPSKDEIVQGVLNLRIEGVGIGNQIKVFFMGLAQKIMSLFGD
ncbi:MAG: hypothetical protein SCJ97_10480 [Bacillota bacterium]|nr:hypothetical protein [Bacillota bacterium]